MELAFRALLTGAAAVTARVPAARINWDEHPQGEAFPGVVLTLIGGVEGISLDGPDGLVTSLVQVDCYGADFDEARRVAEAINERLNGYSGGAIQMIRAAGVRAGRVTEAARRPSRRSLDFEVVWNRS